MLEQVVENLLLAGLKTALGLTLGKKIKDDEQKSRLALEVLKSQSKEKQAKTKTTVTLKRPQSDYWGDIENSRIKAEKYLKQNNRSYDRDKDKDIKTFLKAITIDPNITAKTKEVAQRAFNNIGELKDATEDIKYLKNLYGNTPNYTYKFIEEITEEEPVKPHKRNLFQTIGDNVNGFFKGKK